MSIGHIVLWRTCLRLRSPKHSEKENKQQTRSLKLSETQPSSGSASGARHFRSQTNSSLGSKKSSHVNSCRSIFSKLSRARRSDSAEIQRSLTELSI